MGMATVLLAIDDSPASEHAARVAAELFGPSANYLAISVADGAVPWAPMPMAWGGVYAYPPPYPLVEDDIQAGAGDRASAAEDVAATVADQAGVDAEAMGDIGDPVAAILQAADEHAADVVVVGASDKSWWQRLFAGSVSKDVAEQSHRPVLLVHPE